MQFLQIFQTYQISHDVHWFKKSNMIRSYKCIMNQLFKCQKHTRNYLPLLAKLFLHNVVYLKHFTFNQYALSLCLKIFVFSQFQCFTMQQNCSNFSSFNCFCLNKNPKVNFKRFYQYFYLFRSKQKAGFIETTAFAKFGGTVSCNFKIFLLVLKSRMALPEY